MQHQIISFYIVILILYLSFSKKTNNIKGIHDTIIGFLKKLTVVSF
ncbi:hypothetical protein AF65_04370 [Streptococcus uberis C5388]|nr:hypothetical protein AF64_04300 [Streptococcus uberis C9359]KKF53455.1 hypothetical protein AF65_04370 [Streptococcus uberis C5388]KKF54484.1 hypothetical protein AF66_06900 [Streptococcus uberis B190]